MGKFIKKIFKILLILIIVVLNVLIWGRIYISNDAPITKKIIVEQSVLNDMKENPLSYTVKQYFPPTTMDELGKVQMRYVTHIEELDDLQFTLKYNIKYFDGKTPLKFDIRHVSGENETVYHNPFNMIQDRYIFRYLRFSCRGIGFEEGDSVFVDVYTSDGSPFVTLTLISPDISSMDIKTVTLKTMVKE